MDPNYRTMVAFLRDLGIEDVPHTGSKGFFSHLIGVYRDLESWNSSQDVCRAGLFHSIYGTELFRRWALPLERRGEVQDLIGKRAEWIVYVNCMMDRSTFDALLPSESEPYAIRNRETGDIMEMSREDYDDLARVHLCDWLEQVERSARWDYRADAFRSMAKRLGGVAQESYERVFTHPQAAGDTRRDS